MHACKIVSSINSSNNYYITFDYLDISDNVIKSEIDINNIVNYIRLNYMINNTPYVVEYDNIEYETIKTEQKKMTYKLLLTKLNSKLKLLPLNTICEITVFFKKEIDDPSIMTKK